MLKLAEKNLCTGCSACASICPKRCIEMGNDSDGFQYPVFMYPANCVDCGMCENVCPVLNESIRANDNLPSAYAAFTKDERTRCDSSSGGIFTEIAKRIIEQNGVVYGASYDEKFAVCHCCVEEIDNLQKLCGAKYAESNLGSTFLEILNSLKRGKLVLFSGTPCQVAGLKAFLRKEYDNLFCVDFVCHGIPSPMAWKAYVKYRANMDAKGELPENINLRSKRTGWTRYRYSHQFCYSDNVEKLIPNSQSLFMKLFVNDYISRPSCSNCKFKGYSRVSDITLGDFWGIWDIDPEMDDDKGTSLVLVHSKKGEKYWKDISEKMVYREVLLTETGRQNSSILFAAKSNEKRSCALDLIRSGEIEKCESFFVSEKVSLLSRFKQKIRHLVQKLI